MAGPHTIRREGPPYVVGAFLTMLGIGIPLRINLRIAVPTAPTSGSRKQ